MSHSIDIVSQSAELNLNRTNTDQSTANLLSDVSHLTDSDTELFKQINSALKTEKQLTYYKDDVRDYYVRQNELIHSYIQMNHLTALHHSKNDSKLKKHIQHTNTVANAKSNKIRFALNLSFYMTFIIIALKAYTAARSTSIAVISICVDSGLDLISQGILLYSNKLQKRVDLYKYPSGRSRVEPVAIVVFSCLMGMAAVILLIESVQKLASDLTTTPDFIHIDYIVILLIGIVVTIQLAEYIYCRIVAAQTDHSTSVVAIGNDHINDVCINLIGGIPAIIAGYYTSLFWLDPLGGIVLALYIAFRWSRTCIEQLPILIGKTADPTTLSKLTYLAMTHNEAILHVDTVLAYYSGPKLWAEVHIVLPGSLTLQEAHDIGEALEATVEAIDNVEMCFVHLDYETSHKPEHGRGHNILHTMTQQDDDKTLYNDEFTSIQLV